MTVLGYYIRKYINGIKRSVYEKLLYTRKTDSYFALFSNDLVSTEILLYGVTEIGFWEPFFNLIDFSKMKKYNAIDCGSNLGSLSEYFSRKFNLVYSFEANPKIFELLKINLENVETCIVYNKALSDVNEERIVINVPLNNYGAGSRRLNHGIFKSHTSVSTTLDYENLSSIAFIKIDVEGMEYNVLKGAEKTIREQLPLIVYEQLNSEIKDGSSSATDLLTSLGYLIYIMEFDPYHKDIHKRRIFRLLKLFDLRPLSYKLIQLNQLEDKNYYFLIAIHPNNKSFIHDKHIKNL